MDLVFGRLVWAAWGMEKALFGLKFKEGGRRWGALPETSFSANTWKRCIGKGASALAKGHQHWVKEHQHQHGEGVFGFSFLFVTVRSCTLFTTLPLGF